MKRQIVESDICDEIKACPYCGAQLHDKSTGHCHESSAHMEDAFLLHGGEVVLTSEVEIVNGSIPATSRN